MIQGKFWIVLVLCVLPYYSNAQQQSKLYQPFGQVDTSDLKMTRCDFEKDANAEVLFDRGVYERAFLERHVRIKIFTQAGVNNANIKIRYFNYLGAGISGIKAHTININNGKIEITPVDKKTMFYQTANKFYSDWVFTFPNVRPGSIIEYQYTLATLPNWEFQSELPTRYSEIKAILGYSGSNKFLPYVTQPFFINKGGVYDADQDKALINIPSLPDEPYMAIRQDNLERVEYSGNNSRTDSWKKIGDLLLQFDDFGWQLNRSLAGEDTIIKRAKTFKTDDEKTDFIYSLVKDKMKWNDLTTFSVNVGTSKAWDTKIGTSAEINMILYHLLKKSGINAFPMMVSTQKYVRMNPYTPNPYCFNNMVVYIPVDTTKVSDVSCYVLDASNKFNLFNELPVEQLNKFGLVIIKDDDGSKCVFLERKTPEMRRLFLNAEIKPDGSMAGTAQISNFGNNRINCFSNYKIDGEKKMIDSLTDKNNSLKISSLKLINMDTDTLPLIQDINFSFDNTGFDGNYIYLNTNFFITPYKNPFLSDTRTTDIDIKYPDNIIAMCIYKLPAGYNIEALPKSTSMTLPDKSMSFKRIVIQQDGKISVRYTISHKKSLYFKDGYADFHEFYKKMYEMLNEQIVLKKG